MRVMFEVIDGYIYFVQMETGPIKIGRAKNPHTRLTQLQVGSPYKLNLLFFFPGGAKSENATHTILSNERIRGEWYWPTKRVFLEIQSEEALNKRDKWSMKKYNPKVDFKDNRLESTESTGGG